MHETTSCSPPCLTSAKNRKSQPGPRGTASASWEAGFIAGRRLAEIRSTVFQKVEAGEVGKSFMALATERSMCLGVGGFGFGFFHREEGTRGRLGVLREVGWMAHGEIRALAHTKT